MKKVIYTLLCATLMMTLATSCEEDEATIDIDNGEILDTEFPEDLEDEDVSLFPDLVQVILEDERVEVEGYEDSYVELYGSSSVTITGGVESLVGSVINIKSADARVYLPAISYEEWSLVENNILVFDRTVIEGVTGEIKPYYDYIYIEPSNVDYSPATIYAGEESAEIERSTIYLGSEIPLGDNTVDRIFLKRGYQIVVAASEDGCISSRCYVAASDDLTIELDETLSGQVSFMRCLAIDYVTKRGAGGKSYHSYVPPFDLGWFYTWQTTPQSAVTANMWPIPDDPHVNFLPMFWNSVSDSAMQTVIDSEAPIVLFLNEPDNSDQANKTVEEALVLYRKVHAMGVRLVTPAVCAVNNWSSTNNTAATWIHSFMDAVIEEGLRYDAMGLHWYGWGYSYTDANAGSNGAEKLMLSVDTCYEKYKKPIFITELNIYGSATGTEYRNGLFFDYVIPVLEAAEHVERYAIFPPGGALTWLLASGNTSFNDYGTIYCENHPSTPSIVLADDSRETEETEELN